MLNCRYGFKFFFGHMKCAKLEFESFVECIVSSR